MNIIKINPKTKKFFYLVFCLIFFWIGGLFTVNLFKDNIEYFLTPQQIKEQFIDLKKDRKIRIGGLVVVGSIVKTDQEINFTITDNFNSIKIKYKGIVTPPIFKENVGVIARGYLIDEENFVADQLIGKHDENYMPTKYSK